MDRRAASLDKQRARRKARDEALTKQAQRQAREVLRRKRAEQRAYEAALARQAAPVPPRQKVSGAPSFPPLTAALAGACVRWRGTRSAHTMPSTSTQVGSPISTSLPHRCGQPPCPLLWPYRTPPAVGDEEARAAQCPEEGLAAALQAPRGRRGAPGAEPRPPHGCPHLRPPAQAVAELYAGLRGTGVGPGHQSATPGTAAFAAAVLHHEGDGTGRQEGDHEGGCRVPPGVDVLVCHTSWLISAEPACFRLLSPPPPPRPIAPPRPFRWRHRSGLQSGKADLPG